MREGDVLSLAYGTTAVITKAYGEQFDEPVIVYNFEVKDFHTYYVTDIGVLVHNNQNCVQVRENYKNGKEFEEEQFSELQEKYPNAKSQVATKPIDADGNAMKKGGNYFDAIYKNKEGKIIIVEYKLTESAPYTKNQVTNGFAEGKLNKPLVLVGNYGDDFLKGMTIPAGTTIITIRGQ